MRGIKRFLRERGIVSYFMRNRRWVTLSICLIISALMWLMITLSTPGGYTKEIRVKVDRPILPAGYIMTDSTEYPSDLTLKIHASGGALFKYSLSTLFHKNYHFRPTIDSLSLNADGGEWRLSILELKTEILSGVLKELKGVVTDYAQDVIVSPAEIALSYMPLVHKPIEVIFSSQVDYGDRANLRLVDSVTISPSTVQMYGSEERINTIKRTQPFVPTKTTSIKLSNPGQTSHKIALVAPEGTTLEPDSVTVILTTEELMHYTKSIENIEVRNLPSGYTIQLFPETVKVTYLIPKIIAADDEPFPIHLYVDASDILKGLKKRLDVHILDVPQNVEMVQLVPDQVQFIIKENPVP